MSTYVAEGEGFEPSIPFGMAVFKTARFNHSRTPPEDAVVMVPKIGTSRYAMLYAMRFLGIDYGTKRVGTALSDEGGVMAFPHETYPNDAELLSRVAALIAERGAREVVLGRSENRSGEPNPVQKDIDAFAAALEKIVPVHFVPEHYSTQAALRLQGRTEQTDASAAALLLDFFLQQRNTDHHD